MIDHYLKQRNTATKISDEPFAKAYLRMAEYLKDFSEYNKALEYC